MLRAYKRKHQTALLLCLLLGCFGAHRFYVGKAGTAVLYMLLGGVFVIGAFVDLILIIVGQFDDIDGHALE